MPIVEDRNDCVGCYACYAACPQNCISMTYDNEGLVYPIISNEYCIKCGTCVKVCPVINHKEPINRSHAYACINTNEKVRSDSSSGGIFSLIAEEIVDQGGIVFGAGYDDDFNVVHSFVDSKDKIKKFRGSKYVQSRIGDTYKNARDFLEKGILVLFSGTPCQIEGLKSYLGRKYDKLYTIDLICHGVPSPKVWNKYLNFQKKRTKKTIERVSFRHKEYGWRQFSMKIMFSGGERYCRNLHDDAYLKAFMTNISLRPSCYQCRFKSISRNSDLTLGDFWGVQFVAPKIDDNKGTSLVIVNSEKGDILLKKVEGDMIYKKVNVNEAVSYNTAAISSVDRNPNREKFFKAIDNVSFDKLVRRLSNERKGKKLLRRIKRMLIK